MITAELIHDVAAARLRFRIDNNSDAPIDVRVERDPGADRTVTVDAHSSYDRTGDDAYEQGQLDRAALIVVATGEVLAELPTAELSTTDTAVASEPAPTAPSQPLDDDSSDGASWRPGRAWGLYIDLADEYVRAYRLASGDWCVDRAGPPGVDVAAATFAEQYRLAP